MRRIAACLVLGAIVAYPWHVKAALKSDVATGQLTVFFMGLGNEVASAQLAEKKWKLEIIDRPSGFLGSSLSATMAATGSTHVSYRATNRGKKEYEQSNLHYATNASGRWRDRAIYKTDGRVGSTAITADPAGAAHIVFNYYPPDVPRNGELRYATNETGRWRVELISAQATTNNGAAATDATGRVHTVYVKNNAIFYATRIAANRWTEELVAIVTGRLPAVAMALDADRQPHIAYVRRDAQQLYYAWQSGGAWQIELVTSWVTDSDQDLRLALDKDNNAHLVLTTGPGKEDGLHYFSRGQDGWMSEKIADPFDVVRYPSLEITTDDIPHVTFMAGTLQYARRVNNHWLVEPVHARGAPVDGGFPVLATLGSAPEFPDCLGRQIGLYCPDDPSPVPNPNISPTPTPATAVPAISNDDGGGGGGDSGGDGSGDNEPFSIPAKKRVLGARVVGPSALDKAAPDFILNHQVAWKVAQLFLAEFGRPITNAESTYWKTRARSDKSTETKLRGALAWHKAQGSTGISQGTIRGAWHEAGPLFSRISAPFRSVYARDPRLSEKWYWISRLADKTTAPSLYGAMLFHKQNSIQH